MKLPRLAGQVRETTSADDFEARVVGALDQLVKAVLEGRADALDEMVTADFLGIGFAGQQVDKRAYVDVHVPGGVEGRFTRFDIDERTVQPLGTDLALVRGTQSVTARFELRSRFVQFWKTENDRWRLAYHQETAIVDPELFAGPQQPD